MTRRGGERKQVAATETTRRSVECMGELLLDCLEAGFRVDFRDCVDGGHELATKAEERVKTAYAVEGDKQHSVQGLLGWSFWRPRTSQTENQHHTNQQAHHQ